MKGYKHIIYIAVCSFAGLYQLYFQQIVYAEGTLGKTIDCTDVSVDYLENLTLTKEERIRLMDKAFFQSLNKFELCWEAKKMAETAGGGDDGDGNNGGGGGDGAAGDAGGKEGGMSTRESVASPTMSGADAPQEYPQAEGGKTGASGARQSSQNAAEAGGRTGGNMQRSNGKLPDDISPAKNDDALAAQIRYAAENEKDPVKSKQLWNEYRKYKGLPSR